MDTTVNKYISSYDVLAHKLTVVTKNPGCLFDFIFLVTPALCLVNTL